MATKENSDPKGMYLRGSTWWTRVRDPVSRSTVLRSTGMTSEATARRVKTMLDELAEDRGDGYDWLARIVARDVQLVDVYNHRARGALRELRASLEKRASDGATAVIDPDLSTYATHGQEKSYLVVSHVGADLPPNDNRGTSRDSSTH